MMCLNLVRYLLNKKSFLSLLGMTFCLMKYMCGVLLRFKFFPHVDEFSFTVVELILQKRKFL